MNLKYFHGHKAHRVGGK